MLNRQPVHSKRVHPAYAQTFLPQLPPELNTELHTFVGMNDDGDGNYTADELAEKWRTTKNALAKRRRRNGPAVHHAWAQENRLQQAGGEALGNVPHRTHQRRSSRACGAREADTDTSGQTRPFHRATGAAQTSSRLPSEARIRRHVITHNAPAPVFSAAT